jgi:hypothetical protein
MGLKYDFHLAFTGYTAYQHTDYNFDVEILDDDGVVIDPSIYTNAQYIIGQVDTGAPISRQSLGNGIEVVGQLFKVRVPREDLKYADTFLEQFVVFDSIGDVLEPVFQRRLRVKSVMKWNYNV